MPPKKRAAAAATKRKAPAAKAGLSIYFFDYSITFFVNF
jgi:hypothetical protein